MWHAHHTKMWICFPVKNNDRSIFKGVKKSVKLEKTILISTLLTYLEFIYSGSVFPEQCSSCSKSKMCKGWKRIKRNTFVAKETINSLELIIRMCFLFFVFLIQVFKERPLSLSWLPADVALVTRFSSNRRFFNEMVLYREWVCEVEQPRQGQWGKRENTKTKSNEQTKLWTCSTLFGRFLCRHRKTNVVKLHRSGNAIV